MEEESRPFLREKGDLERGKGTLAAGGPLGIRGPPLRSAWQGSGQGDASPFMSHELAGLAPPEVHATASFVHLCRSLPAVRPIPGPTLEAPARLGADLS